MNQSPECMEIEVSEDDVALEDATAETQDQSFFRCRVHAEQSEALIRMGRRRARVTVQETSIDGFTVLVEPGESGKLKVGRAWVLEHEGTLVEIHPEWFFNSPDGHVQMGLRRLRDLTPPAPIRKSLLAHFGGRRCEDPSFSAAIFGGFVLFLFSLLALPGLGDRLGTAPRIQNTVKWVINGIDQSLHRHF